MSWLSFGTAWGCVFRSLRTSDRWTLLFTATAVAPTYVTTTAAARATVAATAVVEIRRTDLRRDLWRICRGP
ncbi:hypothetical protein AHiyo8_46250 [Arthrobacter sp. Hiyo8]|nr:hypothetical protein AHiyo8_46250 [Arthrobacter sp. Hiyo8]